MLPADDRLEALTDAILSMRRRLSAIEQRLARLEGVPEPVEPAPAPVVVAPPILPPPLPIVAEAPEREPEPESTRALETRLGLTWINRIGTVTVILGVAFFFKYAVDNQWIGEAGRVVLGVVAAFAALAFGEWTWRRGFRIYAQGITATGIAILYLTFWAAFQVYHLVPQGFAFALMVAATAMAAALAMHYGAQAIAVLGLVGGFLTPILLSTNVDRPWALFSYLLLLDAGALLLARARRWKALGGVALGGTTILYAAWLEDRFNAEKQVVATVSALAYYALFALAESEPVLAVSQVLANLAALAIFSGPEPMSLWMRLALAVTGLALTGRRQWPVGQAVVFGAWWVTAIRPMQADAGTAAGLTLGFALFLGWAAWRLLVERIETRTQDLAIVALNGAAYFGLMYGLFDPHYHAYMGLLAAALAGIHLALGLRLWNAQPEESRDARPVLLLVGVALAFLTLAAPIQFSSYRITMAWAVEAAALTWIGRRTGSERMVQAALVVFVLTLARLWPVDSWIYTRASDYVLVANGRFLTFLTAAVALFLSARWIGAGVMALGPYVAGHFVLLWALGMEVLGWAERSTPPANLLSVETVSISILMAAYGGLLVALGVLTKTGINRMLGLGLLGIVVVKLYLYDVWQLEKVYRIVAFSSLGVVLLATSYLYSRYRAKIENWWRDEDSRS